MKNIKIKNKLLGLDCPIFISAEIGVTCNGDISLTKELIDAAKMAGADAVKLIFWFPEERLLSIIAPIIDLFPSFI